MDPDDLSHCHALSKAFTSYLAGEILEEELVEALAEIREAKAKRLAKGAPWVQEIGQDNRRGQDKGERGKNN